MKRIVCFLLILGLLPVLYVPAGAAEPAAGRFTDIPDAETQRAAELLYNLGIISGTGGTSFSPNGMFDRAALAVIGVKLSDIFDVSAYGGTVRFPDVRANHWAHKWVMAAVDLRIMAGGTDGSFRPADPMLYGHLVTVLMKLLGYTDTDVGLNWPQSYISKAEALGVSKNMSFSAGDKLTRAQAARIIYNFLFCDMKEGGVYIEQKMGATYIDTILSFETAGGVTVIDTGAESYSYTGALDESLNGTLASILVDKDDNVLSVTADDTVTYRQAIVRTAQARGLDLADGAYVPIPATAGVWEWDSSATRSYSEVYKAFWEDEPVVLAYKENGSLMYILRNSADNKSGAQNVTTLLRMLTRDGQTYAVDENGTEYRVRGSIDSALCGRTGRLTIDRDGFAVSFTASKTYTYTSVTLSEARANGVQPDTGSFVSVPAATTVWGTQKDTYGETWLELQEREMLLLAYNSAGSLQYVARVSQRGTGGYRLAVLEQKPVHDVLTTAFGAEAKNATLYKNGVIAMPDMLEQWDVLMYYESSNVVEASNIRISGPYSAARPNPTTPSHITVMGTELELLPEATDKIPDLPIGRSWTYFLTADGRIADIRDSNAAGKTTLGLVTKNGVSLSDTLHFDDTVLNKSATQLGKISQFMGVSGNEIYVTPMKYEAPGQDFSLAAMSLGSAPAAPWCTVYEQVGDAGHAKRIAFSDIPVSRVPASSILYAEIDSNGYVTVLLLNDVTGDAYTYGFIEKQERSEVLLNDLYTYTALSVSASGKGDTLTDWLHAGHIEAPSPGRIVGISSGNTLSGTSSATKLIICDKHEGLTRYDFSGSDAIMLGSASVPIADGVKVLVRSTGETLSIADARAYCSSFEVYTDPWGYKVRFIIGMK